MIDVRKLRLLAALDRLGTISAVAEEVHLSAPGVSMQLSALESELGVQLTHRRGRRLVLTAAGHVLAAHGHDILGRLSLAELDLESLREGSIGRYTLTAFPSAARTFVAEASKRVLNEAAAFELRLTTSEPDAALAQLLSGAADLAVIHSYSNVPRGLPSGISSRPIGHEQVWLATRDVDTVPTVPVRLEDYADAPWIAPNPEVTCFTMMERACGLAGFQPRVVAESMDFAVQLEWVAAGVGVALVPALTVAKLPDDVVLRELERPVERSIHLAARTPVFADPGVQTLARILTDSAASRLSAED